MTAVADEETMLVAGHTHTKKKPVSFQLNIEALRCFGLFAIIVLLVVGYSMTNAFVELEEGDGRFIQEKSFIYKTFHFSHTCVVLDFNPAKTLSALVMMLHTIPMDLYIILAYYRIEFEWANKEIPYGLVLYSRITSPIVFIFFTYFYMVFVNSPEGKMGDFILHYIPYMCWQWGIILMAIQQCYYISVNLKQVTPWHLSRDLLKAYCVFLVALLIYYTCFVWSFILGTPILDTTQDSRRILAQVIMYGFNVFAIVIPMFFAYWESKNDNFSVIQFHDMRTDAECRSLKCASE